MTTGEVTSETALLEAEDLLNQRDLNAAMESFDAAEALGADADRCSAGRWMVSMLCGAFRSAWRESDAIRLRGAPDPHRFWNGEDIRGKRIIVRCLHGFGDAVQFLRYAPALREIAHEVTFEVPPRFVDLARCFDGVDHVITWGEAASSAPPQWDVQLEIMELPYFFRTTIHDLPVAEHYLHLPADLVADVTKRMGPPQTPRVGLVWSAGEWNLSRCLPTREVASILDVPGFEFWNLQGPESELGEACPNLVPLREADGCRNSIATLAAVISKLDLVITVDTLAAHLAGALRVPAWIMLQYAADWRWMTGTLRSPWYPSLRLFRQRRPGNWTPVSSAVRDALSRRLLESTAEPVAS